MKTFLIILAVFLAASLGIAADTTVTYTNSVVGNGTIDSLGTFTLYVGTAVGDSADTYVIAAGSGYFIDSVVVDGVNQGRVYSYATGVIAAGDTIDHTIVAYFGSSVNPITPTWTSYGIRHNGGESFAHWYTRPSYLAYDSLYFVSPVFNPDWGGNGYVYAGVVIDAMTDTLTDPKFVLEGSYDNGTHWVPIDSITVTTPEITGTYVFNKDLTNFRLPQWRWRFGVPNALWNGVASPTVPGRFHFFFLQPTERW